MARSFRPVTGSSRPGEFDGSGFFHEISRERFTFTWSDGEAWIRRSQPGPGGAETNVFEERVDYVIGAGSQAISYLHRTRDNKLTEFPVSWYPENGGHWGMSPAYDRPDHPGFSREVNFACTQCHNALPDTAPTGDSPGETIFPEQLPEGIDCQRCHGPGQAHADAASQGRSPQQIRASIVNPALLYPARQNEVCFQCHLETTSSRLPASLIRPDRGMFSWRPGQPLSDFMLAFDRVTENLNVDSVELVGAPYRLARSACVRSDGEPLTCITCHDPHLAPTREESVRKTDGICAACHQAKLAGVIAGGRHSADRECVGCHMPQRKTDDVIHASITDHWISRPHPGKPPTAEINARNVPPYAGEAMLYYPKSLPQTAGNSTALAIAQVQSNPAEAFRRLEQATANYRPENPEIAAEIGRAFLMLSQPAKAMDWYRLALAGSPGRWSYLAGLGNAQQAAGRPDLAADSFARASALAPWETDVLFSLGQSYAKLGKFEDAIRVLRQAVERNPESAAAFNDLGSALLRMAGRASGAEDFLREAETALREAVRIQPEFVSLRMNLADSLLRQNKLREAREQLEEAIRIGGRGETAEAEWFETLLATGSAERALKAWNSSFAAQVSGAHNNLGTLFASQNRPEDAIREYRLAVEGDPRSAMAQFNLGVTLYGRGLKSEAIPLLRKAAETGDPGIRAAVSSLLEKQ